MKTSLLILGAGFALIAAIPFLLMFWMYAPYRERAGVAQMFILMGIGCAIFVTLCVGCVVFLLKGRLKGSGKQKR